MSRGSKIALNQHSRRNAEGRSLPSDRSMQFIAVDLICRSCHPELSSLLARFAIDTWHERFLPEQVYERGDNKGIIERQPTENADGSGGVRYVFQCWRPGCRNRPVFRSETLDRLLERFYIQGARDVVIPIPV